MALATRPMPLSESAAVLGAAVRSSRVWRGVVRLAFVLVLLAACALLADAALNLSATLRFTLFIIWVAVGFALGGVWIARPLVRRFTVPEILAWVESRSPDQQERFSRILELRESPSAAESVGIDKPLRWLLVPVVVWGVYFLVIPNAGDRLRRFVLPWSSHHVPASYRVVISSGDPVVKRGEAVTLTAYLERVRPEADLPTEAVLTIRNKQSDSPLSLPMASDEASVFAWTLPDVMESCEYRVEVGSEISEWHTVHVVNPVRLAEGTKITITPPDYARAVIPVETRPFDDVTAMQQSDIELSLHFTEPAQSASLTWTPEGRPVQEIPLLLAGNSRSGTARLPLTDSGTLKLTLIGEREVRTEFPIRIHVGIDQPPRFETIRGLWETTLDVRPDDTLVFDLAIHDDVQIASVAVEYCVNGKADTARSETLSLPGLGTRRAEGTIRFPLTGKVAVGETLGVRLHVTDNRSVPGHQLSPQITTFPGTGWVMCRAGDSAKPVTEQLFQAARDEIHHVGMKVVRHLTTAEKEAALVAEQSAISPEQSVRFRTMQYETMMAMVELDVLAKKLKRIPALRLYATWLQSVADEQISVGNRALSAAETDADITTRRQSLLDAIRHFREAGNQLQRLLKRNDEILQERLAERAIRDLADAVQELADDPPAGEEWVKQQRRLLNRLEAIVASNSLLREADRSASARELASLFDHLSRLSDDAVALAEASEQTDHRARILFTREQANQQRELNDIALSLAKRTASAARIAETSPLPLAPFQAALTRLDHGQPADAAAEQEKAARELDRLADALDFAAKRRSDQHHAARQFIRWHEDLQRRYLAGARTLVAEERAIRQAIGLLSLRDPDANQHAAQKQAISALDAAIHAMTTNPDTAKEALQTAGDALMNLASLTPTNESQLRRSRELIDQIRRDNALSPEQITARLASLDLPGLETRQRLVIRAYGRAAEDVRRGYTQDRPVSLQIAKRQLDRLRESLDGGRPADEQAVQLAWRQRQIEAAIGKVPGEWTDTELRRLVDLQHEITRGLGAMNAPEVAGLLATARTTATALEYALRKKERAATLLPTAHTASLAVTRLADRLVGAESDLATIERLAKECRDTPDTTDADLARREILRRLDELARVRVGTASREKAAAEAALLVLRNGSMPMHRLAATTALDRLANAMQQAGDFECPAALTGPAEPSAEDRLQQLDGMGSLPTTEDAEATRLLARRQRNLRDISAQSAANLVRKLQPATEDPLGSLIPEQIEIVEEAGKLLNHEESEGVEALRVGNGVKALSAGLDMERLLHAMPKNPMVEALIERQSRINARLREWQDHPVLELARQREQRKELISQLDRLAEELRSVQTSQAGSDLERSLATTATDVDHARSRLRQADRDFANARHDTALVATRDATARLAMAGASMKKMVQDSPAVAGGNARLVSASDAIRAATRLMREAATPDPKRSPAVMKNASDSLSKAAHLLQQPE